MSLNGRRFAEFGGTRRGGRDSSVATATYQSILGALLVEMWHSQLGIATVSGNVDTWTGQVQGVVLQAPGAANRPAYAADVANFTTGLSMPQFDGTNDSLQVVNLATPLYNVARPGWILVYRLRSIPGTQSDVMAALDHPVTAVIPKLYVDATQKQQILYSPSGATANIANVGTAPHFGEIGQRTATNFCYGGLDAVDAAAAAGAAIALACRDVYLGNDRGGNFAPMNLCLALVVNDEPSAAQRAAVRARARAEFGF